MDEKTLTLILTNEEGDWLDPALSGTFFNEEIRRITHNQNWLPYNSKEPYVNKLLIAIEDLSILLSEMDRIKKQYTKGADFSIASSIASKIKILLREQS